MEFRMRSDLKYNALIDSRNRIGIIWIRKLNFSVILAYLITFKKFFYVSLEAIHRPSRAFNYLTLDFALVLQYLDILLTIINTILIDYYKYYWHNNLDC